ncbi:MULTISPECIES: hypothetical protein [Okeania]|uniref:Uncharacterized protein n=1 Tax=Okeania hirsuta TaxID=1458930 RepID=A0A3N6P4E9_9CYAN|nr:MULTISPECIES: hypothetical protein [Okeania]NES79016.1 hypothetical protein [Okeania sp. SIO1H4]NES89674.1 hypothetical protein [Okeania sp. SIO2B9]NET22648.1 hypothetical protein [Okeania sp. SIO1H5]NET79181.1 hypothetical protein [Okeania sp. SIO1F9]NET95837.1 hypothetical protein [Okeania sp. SIO1H2]
MSQDITPWLNEIKALQEKIVKLQTELNVAQDSASKWRQLYNTEAQQRRTETQLAQETIQTLKAQAQKLQGFPSVEESIDESATTIEQQIENLQTLAEFKAKIIEVVQERERAFAQVQKLTEALEQEKVNHTNTRTSLTNALADAVDILAKAKASKQQKSEITPDIQPKTEANIQAQNQIQLKESLSPNAAQLPPNERPLPRLPSSKD